MGLSNDLISQFVKVTKDDKQKKKEETVYGTTIDNNGEIYVKLDGSDLITPISKTADMKPGERVMVMIKNHTAIVTGNISSPAARTGTVTDLDVKMGNKISEFEVVIADKVSAEELDVERGRIDILASDNVTINEKLTANTANITKIEADNITINKNVTANKADIDSLKTSKLDADTAEITYATIDSLAATDANVSDLQTNKLSATDAALLYANIDFSNIGEAAITKLFNDSGIIKDLVVSDGHITGELVGVTIKGDIIEGGTVKADKLVVKGSDGLFYKLNTDGVTTTAEQTEYNSLNGSVITAKSVTAEKVNVDDLVAFDATIGGFNITDSSIYSGAKNSAENTTSGIYLDKDGQMAIGDATNFIKYYKDSTGAYKLAISAESITFGTNSESVSETINQVKEAVNSAIMDTDEEFYLSSSPTVLSDGTWSQTQPTWENGKYIWRRSKNTYGDGSVDYTPNQNGVCISGNTGAKGEKGADGDPAVTLIIDSSNGNIFKNSSIATALTVTIIVGEFYIQSYNDLVNYFGEGVKLYWKTKENVASEFTYLDESDPRISDNGFIFTLTANDVNRKLIASCELDIPTA